MKKIERTKENIKVNELDEQTRKQLFKKFVEAGGKVIDEREKPSTRIMKSHRIKKSYTPIKKTDEPNQKSYRKETSQPEIIETWFQKKLTRLFIRLKLFFLGVTSFTAIYFKPRFLYNTVHTYKTALLQFQVQYFKIFNQQYGKKLIEKLDAINPLYYELIVMISNIFDRTKFNEIEALLQTETLINVQKLKNHFIAMYKTLYILYPYIELIEQAFRNAFEIQSSIEKQNASIYEKRKYIRNSLYITFYKFLPRLHILFCHYYNIYVDITSPYIRTILNINESDLPGKRKVIHKEEDHKKQEIQKKEEPHIPPHIIKGLSLMNLSSQEILSLFPKDLAIQINPSDKAIIAYALFKRFDDELSMVLTTNKIKYNIQFTEQGKIDYKNRISDCYNMLRKVYEDFEEYIHVVTTYELVRNEKPMSNMQYIEYTKRLTQLEKKKIAESKNIRMLIKATMDKIASELEILIHDMDTENKIIENPQDFLDFDLNIEHVHILQDKKVYEAINLAYCYACALSYRLSEGDLAGDLEFKEGETVIGIDVNKKITSQISEENNQKETSVIKELEDLF